MLGRIDCGTTLAIQAKVPGVIAGKLEVRRAKTVPNLRIASWSVGSFKRRRFAEVGRVNNDCGRYLESSDSDASDSDTDDLQDWTADSCTRQTVNSAQIHRADISMGQRLDRGLTNRGMNGRKGELHSTSMCCRFERRDLVSYPLIKPGACLPIVMGTMQRDDRFQECSEQRSLAQSLVQPGMHCDLP